MSDEITRVDRESKDMPSSSGITCIICVCDEEDLLVDCLASIRWVDEILIIDCDASEKARRIFGPLAGRVLQWPRPAYADLIRDRAAAEASFSWILWLDPDERVSETLGHELRHIAKHDLADNVRVPLDTEMFGCMINHAGWGGGSKMRFYKREFVTWPAEVHSGAVVAGRSVKLDRSNGKRIMHINYTSIEQFVEKLNRYTTGEAARLDGPVSFRGTPYAIQDAFVHRFIDLEGYRDGEVGLHLANLMTAYAAATHAKTWQAGNHRQASAMKMEQSLVLRGVTGHWLLTTRLFFRRIREIARKKPEMFPKRGESLLLRICLKITTVWLRVVELVLTRRLVNEADKEWNSLQLHRGNEANERQ